MGRNLKEIILTDNMRNRIKERQKALNIPDSLMAHCCNDNIHSYKNIKTKTKSIDSKTLARIAHELQCSTEYLCCKTDETNIKIRNDVTIQTEIPFTDHTNEYLYNINTCLRADNALLRALHLWLVDLPENVRTPFISFLKATTSSLNEFNLAIPMMDKTIGKNKLSALQDSLEVHDDESLEAIIQHSKSIKFFKKMDFKRALRGFLSVIITYYDQHPCLFPYAEESISYIEKMESITTEQSSNLPNTISEALPKIIQLLLPFKDNRKYRDDSQHLNIDNIKKYHEELQK